MPGIIWAVLVQDAGLVAHSQSTGGLRVLGPVRLCFCLGLARMVRWLGEFEGVLVRESARCMVYKGKEILEAFQ